MCLVQHWPWAVTSSLEALGIMFLGSPGRCHRPLLLTSCHLVPQLSSLPGLSTFLNPGLSLSPFLQSSPLHKMKETSPLVGRKIIDKIHFQTIHSESSDTFSDQSPTVAQGSPIHQGKAQMEVQFVIEEDLEALGAAAPPLPVAEELKPPAASTAQTTSKTDSPSRKKGMELRAWGSQATPSHAVPQRHSSPIQSIK